jgi:hypothetical protein
MPWECCTVEHMRKFQWGASLTITILCVVAILDKCSCSTFYIFMYLATSGR